MKQTWFGSTDAHRSSLIRGKCTSTDSKWFRWLERCPAECSDVDRIARFSRTSKSSLTLPWASGPTNWSAFTMKVCQRAPLDRCPICNSHKLHNAIMTRVVGHQACGIIDDYYSTAFSQRFRSDTPNMSAPHLTPRGRQDPMPRAHDMLEGSRYIGSNQTNHPVLHQHTS